MTIVTSTALSLRAELGIGSFVQADDSTSQIVEKVREVACCGFASHHLLEQAVKYYEIKEKPHKVRKIVSQLKYIQQLIRNVREIVLQKAIQICRELNREDEKKELSLALDGHFEYHIDSLRSQSLNEEADELHGYWQETQKFLDDGNDFFDGKGLLSFLNGQLSKKAEDAACQIYRVKIDPLTQRESLPGKLVRKTGDKPSGNPEIDDPYGYSEQVVDYVAKFGIDFKKVLGGRPQVTSVHSHIDNAFFNPGINQIVIGKGQHLFKNLASFQSVITHEWFHAVSHYHTGSGLRNGYTGLDYSDDDGGGLEECGADIGWISMALDSLKDGNIDVQLSDPRVESAFTIGRGIWDIKGARPSDGLRKPNGIGYDEYGAVAKKLGKPLEKHYLKWSHWHSNNGAVYNQPVLAGLVQGRPDRVDPHFGSALGLAVYEAQVKEVAHIGVPLQTVYEAWLETYKYIPFKPTYAQFSGINIEVVKSLERILGRGDNLEKAMRNGWQTFDVPIVKQH